jgi:hypothetical protein
MAPTQGIQVETALVSASGGRERKKKTPQAIWTEAPTGRHVVWARRRVWSYRWEMITGVTRLVSLPFLFNRCDVQEGQGYAHLARHVFGKVGYLIMNILHECQ